MKQATKKECMDVKGVWSNNACVAKEKGDYFTGSFDGLSHGRQIQITNPSLLFKQKDNDTLFGDTPPKGTPPLSGLAMSEYLYRMVELEHGILDRDEINKIIGKTKPRIDMFFIKEGLVYKQTWEGDLVYHWEVK